MHSSLIQAWRLGTAAIKQEELCGLSLCKHAYTARAALAMHPHHTAGASLLLKLSEGEDWRWHQLPCTMSPEVFVLRQASA